jgi:hypothetical protein
MDIQEKEYTPNTLNGRTVGEVLPLSIGTALALEILSKENDLLKEYDVLYINLHTVLRNLLGAFIKTPTKTDVGNISKCFIEEYETLLSVVKSHFPKELNFCIFYPRYKSLHRIFPYANIKKPITTLQKEKALIEEMAFKRLLKNYPDIHQGDCKVFGNSQRGVVLTHLPIDLLSASSFRKLSLLESHTGTIKDRPQWITKLNNKGNLNLPFNTLTLTILGDGKMFGALGNPFNKHLSELAEKGKWTTLTTKERIKFDIEKLRNKADVKILMDMLTTTLK